MRKHYNILSLIILGFISSCEKPIADAGLPSNQAWRAVKSISYNGIRVGAVIDKPQNDTVDVLMVFHGTVMFDNKILEAAQNTLDGFKRILDREDMMIVSVAYPEENLLIGDNLIHSEAALLWLKHKANLDLGIFVRKIFLAGHSQGGYIVSRLNTMHSTNGVIANAPGPLNLAYRCQLEENGQIPSGIACNLLRQTYGAAATNPEPYLQRSLLRFTEDHRSDILFVQGMNDSPIQMYSWPLYRQMLNNCSNCSSISFLELPGLGHTALFESIQAKGVFNQFIRDR